VHGRMIWKWIIKDMVYRFGVNSSDSR
jgi:hypothetical protein